MPLANPITPGAGAEVSAESAKRGQIIDGARRCFLAFGFEATSMGEIARESKVSKGTLYVYFDSKEALFAALVEQVKRESADRTQQLVETEADVETTLTRFAVGLIDKLSAPTHVALVRMVIGASEKFPGIARSFYEAGPADGARRLTAYLEEQARLGHLTIPPDQAEIAAWQFLGMCHHPTLISVILAAEKPPGAARARELAQTAVATFLAAYGRRD